MVDLKIISELAYVPIPYAEVGQVPDIDARVPQLGF